MIVEGKKDDYFSGYSQHYIRVLIRPSKGISINDVVNVQISKIESASRVYAELAGTGV